MNVITADVHSKIVQLTKQASEGNILQSVKQIFHVLQSCGAMWDMKIQPRIIGCHPDNRDGYGINVVDVHSWVSDVFTIGFDCSEVKAVCCEVAQDDAAVQTFNEEMAAASNGQLAPVDTRLKYATLWGGHTNQAMRLVAYSVPHSDERLTISGRLSAEKIGMSDAIFQDAVVNGVLWKVISFEVFKAFPELATIIQSAGNAAGQIAKNEHEMQIMRKMWVTQVGLSKACSPGSTVAFADVKSRIMKTKPACAPSLPGMYTFMMKFAGGPSALFLLDTELFVKNNAPSTKMLPADIWSVLSIDIKGPDQAIRFRHGVIKALYTADTLRISPSDIKRCFSKDVIPQVLVASTLMGKMREIVSQNKIESMDMAAALSRFDVAVVAWVMGKSSSASLDVVAHSFIEEARAISKTSLHSDWEPLAPAVPQASAPSVPSNTMREFLPDGSLADPAVILVEQGFFVGASVVRKSDKLIASLKSFDGAFVTLQTATGEIQAPVQDFQSKAWVKFEAKTKPDAIQNWMDHSAHSAKEFQIARVKGLIVDELCELTMKNVKNYDCLALFSKPHRSVMALGKIDKGKLVLVPSSTKITHGADGHLFVVESFGEKFWIAPHVSLPGTKSASPFLSPFWLVEKTTDPELVNMEISTCKVKKLDRFTFTFQIVKNMKALKAEDTLYVLDQDKAKSDENGPKSKKPRP
jgi:hypothetical protein